MKNALTMIFHDNRKSSYRWELVVSYEDGQRYTDFFATKSEAQTVLNTLLESNETVTN